MSDSAKPHYANIELEALRLKAILESAVTGIITIDEHGLIKTMNPAAEKLFGYPAAEIAGRNISMLMPEPYRSQHDAYLAKYLATGHRKIIGIGREVAGLRKNGTTFPMHLSVGEFAIDNVRFFTGTIIDLSAQRDAEARLEREQALFSAIFESIPDPVIVSDAQGVIRLVNQSFTRVFGFEQKDVLAESVERLLAQPEATPLISRLGLTSGDKKHVSLTVEFVRKSGSAFPANVIGDRVVSTSGESLGQLLLVHDVTEEQRQEAIILQAQRMEAVGQLTGGVAHDFNNLLTVILGNLELLEPRLPDDYALSLATEAREAGEMGARLTDRLLTFARRRRLETRRLNLNEFVLGLTELLRRTLGTPIDLSTSLAADLWPTIADPGQIENAVLNLAINARDAMPNGGRLLIETFNTPLDFAAVGESSDLGPGDYVVLSVTDTGHGMSAEVQRRAFEPFFSTKSTGKGSGLGLATIYGFVRQSGGNITIHSELGKGTTVNIFLPRASLPADEHPPKTQRIDDARIGTGELVLVVEDDDKVQRLTVARLQSLGFRVVAASDGKMAIDTLAKLDGIVIVFTDLVMPGGISGLDLARHVRQEFPGISVILTSGYSADLMKDDDDGETELKILRKPYRQSDLARILAEVLEMRRGACRS